VRIVSQKAGQTIASLLLLALALECHVMPPDGAGVWYGRFRPRWRGGDHQLFRQQGVAGFCPRHVCPTGLIFRPIKHYGTVGKKARGVGDPA
jgi:hypothetical protein